MNCGCESLTCPHGREERPCPNKTDNSSPIMPFVGEICEECAQRIRDSGDGWLITYKSDK